MPVSAVLFALALATLTAHAEEPFRTMRALEAVQARVAAGELPATAGAESLAAAAVEFRGQPTAVWADSRNQQALALFLFNGGAPAVVRGLIEGLDPASPDRPVLQAALAHAEGRGKAGLLALDARALPAELGGHLALAQAAALAQSAAPASGDDRKSALDRLDLARLLLPGSLVEEAALRRSVFLLGSPSDASAFAEAVRRYRARYARSPYAANFERRVAATLVGQWSRADASARGALAPAVETLPPADRRALWLAVARGALVVGALEAACDAAAKVGSDSDASPADRSRADLYAAIPALFTRDTGAAAIRLGRLGEHLSGEDRGLLRAAVTVAANILAPVAVLSHEGPPQNASPGGLPSPTDDLIRRAESLAQVDVR